VAATLRHRPEVAQAPGPASLPGDRVPAENVRAFGRMKGRREPLDEDAVAEALGTLPGWQLHREAATEGLTKTFELGSFRAAMAFLVRIGFEAEARDHHPEISNVYGRVGITLRTHDAGNRVTALDVELARAIEALPR
jgi:4a-hydroxytetrahydrobiopterin dehydratase